MWNRPLRVRSHISNLEGLADVLCSWNCAFTDRVKSIISPNESLTPNLLYVGVATLTGSILARNRIIVTRLLLPPLFLVVSAKHFLPQTTSNLSAYLGSLEEAYAPELARKHEVAKAHTQMGWDMVKERTREWREAANKGVEGAVDKVQGATGLKIKEGLGLGQQVVRKVERRVVEVEKRVERKVEEKVAEVVKPAEKVVEKIVDKVEEKLEPVVAEEKVEPVVVEEKKEEEIKRLV